MTKWLKKIGNVGDSTVSSIIQDNLIELFDWGLIDAGGFFNVEIPTSGQFGGDKHKLRLVDDPRYTKGQVWEGFRSNWVWQSGVSTTAQPKTLTKLKPDSTDYPNSIHSPGISGVFVGGAFQPTSGVGTYKHHVDYPNGRVVFDSAISTTSTVTAEFSYKWTKVTKSNEDFFREVQYRSERADGDFTLEASGDWSQLAETRLQLPAMAIEVVKRRDSEPYSLGSLAHYVNTDVLFHVLAEDDYDRDKLLDIVSFQQENTISMFDSDMIGRNNAFPLDYRGMTYSNVVEHPHASQIYPLLLQSSGILHGGFKYGETLSDSHGKTLHITTANVQRSEEISPNLYHGVVRMNTEVIT